MHKNLAQILQKLNCKVFQLNAKKYNNAFIKIIKYNYESNLSKLTHFLSEPEQIEGQAKTNTEAYNSWLTGRIVAKLAIAELLNTSPFNITIYKSKNGKAKHKINSWNKTTIDFSLSHTFNLTIVATKIFNCKNYKIGADVELLNRRIKMKVQDYIFNETEKKMLLDNNYNYPGALAFWCAKEAAGKAFNLAYLNNINKIEITDVDWFLGEITVKNLNTTHNNETKIYLKIWDEYLLATTIKI